MTTHGKVAAQGHYFCVDDADGVLDNWQRFTVDHPTKAASVAWLVLLLA